MRIDMRADLNAEDDNGENWSLLRNAVGRDRVMVGAVLVAGTERFHALVRVTAVDDDGQVHFVQLPLDDPDVGRRIAPTS